MSVMIREEDCVIRKLAQSMQGPYGISLANALNAAPKVSTLVSIVAPSPSTATAPRGRGWVMMPTMVAKKIASRCQACAVTPAIR